MLDPFDELADETLPLEAEETLPLDEVDEPPVEVDPPLVDELVEDPPDDTLTTVPLLPVDVDEIVMLPPPPPPPPPPKKPPAKKPPPPPKPPPITAGP